MEVKRIKKTFPIVEVNDSIVKAVRTLRCEKPTGDQ